MEEEVAAGLGLHVGDTVVVNVLGRDITAKIANLRKVNWRSFAINFVLVFSPNAFTGAPYTELVSAALPRRRARARDRAAAATARQFPAVPACGCARRWRCRGAGGQIAQAIRAASSVALVTSVLVLAGALAANRRARMADATILKILGATRGA